MALDVNTPIQNKLWTTAISADNNVYAKILVDTTPGNVAMPDASLPGAVAPLTRGGCRIIGGQMASTDGTARDVILWTGTVLTTQSAGATGTLQAASTSTITRAAGDFTADGWAVGDGLMLMPPAGFRGNASATQANTGQLFVVHAIVALTITVNGTPLTAETFNTGARLVRVAQRTRKQLPINAGNTNAAPPVALLGGTQDVDLAIQPDTGLSLGPNDVLLVSAPVQISALPAQLFFSAHTLLS
jgi:hypothetical protein